MNAGRAAAAAALAAAALLAACAHVAVGPTEDGLTFAERQMRLDAVPAWEMRGRIAVDTGERGFPGSFVWQQNGSRLDVSVHGPLGAGALEVSGSPAELTVTARGERHVLEDPETDLSELLGWWMPVESLPDWLLGLPDPGYPADVEFGRGTALAGFEQRLWRVTFVSYELRDGMLMPSRIEMSHDDLRIRVNVNMWRPSAAGAQTGAGGGTAAAADSAETATGSGPSESVAPDAASEAAAPGAAQEAAAPRAAEVQRSGGDSGHAPTPPGAEVVAEVTDANRRALNSCTGRQQNSALSHDLMY